MLVKKFDDSITEIEVGYPLEKYFSGRPEIKSYCADGVWINNSSFSMDSAIALVNDEIKRKRNACYREESDPLFFYYMRDKKTKQEWIDKVTEIEQRFPYV